MIEIRNFNRKLINASRPPSAILSIANEVPPPSFEIEITLNLKSDQYQSSEQSLFSFMYFDFKLDINIICAYYIPKFDEIFDSVIVFRERTTSPHLPSPQKLSTPSRTNSQSPSQRKICLQDSLRVN